MARVSETFRCSECGWQAGKWVGRCRGCQAGSTLSAQTSAAGSGRRRAGSSVRSVVQPIDQISATAARSSPSGVPELDRVLGGGLVPGAVVLLAGEPGVGQATLTLAVAAAGARAATPLPS